MIEVTGQLGGDYSELLVLARFTVNEHGYLMTWVTDGETVSGGSVNTYCNQIWQGSGVAGGTYTLLWESPSFSSGVRTIRGYLLGGRLVLMVDGIVMADITDTTPAPTGGNPGFSVHQGASGLTYADNFYATDIVAIPTYPGPDFTETWTGSDGAAWPAGWTSVITPLGTTSATIQGNKGQQQVAGGPGFRADMKTYAPADFDATFDLTVTSGEAAQPRLYFRRSSDGLRVSLVNFDTSANRVRIEYSTDGATTTVVNTSATFTYVTGTYHCRVRAVGLAVAAKIWSGSTEPVAWNASGYVIDASGSDNKIGFALARVTAGTATVQWDDLQVRTLALAVNYNETGRAVSVVSAITTTDQADFKDLGRNIGITATFTVLDTFTGAPPVVQEGYRWRNDDGSQTAATWKAAQDTNVTLSIGEAARLRMLLDTTDDPDPYAYTLYYKKSTDSTWVPVPVGSGGGSPVYIATSANVTASGEVTTAQLTPPAGKTTADFSVGRMWDDENGTDSVDI